MGTRTAATRAEWENIMAQSWRHVAQSDADMAAAMQVSGILSRQV